MIAEFSFWSNNFFKVKKNEFFLSVYTAKPRQCRILRVQIVGEKCSLMNYLFKKNIHLTSFCSSFIQYLIVSSCHSTLWYSCENSMTLKTCSHSTLASPAGFLLPDSSKWMQKHTDNI